jgi:hypothetical protein
MPENSQTQLYALIKKSSQYYSQQHTNGQHFPVSFIRDGRTGLHIVNGNNNRYRLADVNFFVQIEDRFVKISK